ncbi:MAG: DUF1761 domain-containing protein [Herbaspirillum sp.]|uniref:DUF1761 domain-containing protein n=1 Tax=Herbaspirillum sp. TaxID=1890675 RepID=UPI00258C01FD|nr:DUF1761 domain-containing protein [Herbaspirillum sp.]MCP3655294.1 DUF1761 domain-containing protein [Herbaspirillum sp.]
MGFLVPRLGEIPFGTLQALLDRIADGGLERGGSILDEWGPASTKRIRRRIREIRFHWQRNLLPGRYVFDTCWIYAPIAPTQAMDFIDYAKRQDMKFGYIRNVGREFGELSQGTVDQGAAKALPFIIALVALFVMALMLAGLMGHLGYVTIKGGVISGFFVWVGFVITTMGVNHAFGGAKPMLTLIGGGHWLAELLVMGAVISAFGV